LHQADYDEIGTYLKDLLFFLEGPFSNDYTAEGTMACYGGGIR
jgi:hypothetical protein